MDNDSPALADSDGVSVHRGFPNSADDRQRGQLALNLNQLLVRHPSSTFLFRIDGHHWTDQGIYEGDIVLVDRSAEPRQADLVVLWENDSFVICPRRQLAAGQEPWGTIVATIHQYRP